MEKRSIGQRIFSRLLGFFIFLVLIGIAKVLSFYILNDFYSAIIQFFITNLFLSFLIFFITLIGDIFWGFWFPFNIPAPLISAVASIFIVSYISKLWTFLDSYILSGARIPFSLLTKVVFWIVLIGGYVVIMGRLFGWSWLKYEWKKREDKKEESEEEDEKPAKKKRKKKRKK